MREVTRYGETISAYQDKDLRNPSLVADILYAKNTWASRIQEHVLRYGDRGSCSLGAGIYVHYIGPKKRISTKKRIISPQSLSSVQGEYSWTASSKEIVKILKKQGINCWFEHGNMD